jgi:hypothetical protein
MINKTDLPPAQDLIRSLMSITCPACGGPKRPRQTLCPHDYARLTVLQRRALYKRVGEGYEDALVDAMRKLGVSSLKIPPSDTSVVCPRCGFPHPQR